MTFLGRHRLVASLLGSTAGLLLSTAPVASGAAAPSVTSAAAEHQTGRQAIVTLGADRVARSRPRPKARRLQTIAARRPITGVPTALPILSERIDDANRTWLRVPLPGRPNGRTGWITTVDTTRSSTPWRLSVQLSTRTVDVFYEGSRVRRFRAIIGASATPTPKGQFFLEEAVAIRSGTAGGPYALATNARSAVLQSFNGGPGQIALHGKRGLSGLAGSASSHGCLRLSDRAITWLATRVTAGSRIAVR